MRNNIASFEKTSRSRVKIVEKINAEFIFALHFGPKYDLTTASFLKRNNIIYYSGNAINFDSFNFDELEFQNKPF